MSRASITFGSRLPGIGAPRLAAAGTGAREGGLLSSHQGDPLVIRRRAGNRSALSGFPGELPLHTRALEHAAEGVDLARGILGVEAVEHQFDALVRVEDVERERRQREELADAFGRLDREARHRDLTQLEAVFDAHGERPPTEGRKVAPAKVAVNRLQPLRGSSASRNPSPRKLSARRVAARNALGKTSSHHGEAIGFTTATPSATSCPQDSSTPSPRKDRYDSRMITEGTPSVATTTIGPRQLGRTCRNRMRASEAPSARAASTKSRPRSASTSPRTIRAMPSHCTRPSATNTGRARPRAVSENSNITRMTRNMYGRPYRKSTMRINASSTAPPT